MTRKRLIQQSMDSYVYMRESGRFKRNRFEDELMSDARSVVQAYAEFESIQHNEYVDRAHRKLSEDEIPRCSCQSAVVCSEICNDGCENRSMQVECIMGKCATGNTCSNQRFQRGFSVALSLAQGGGKGISLVAEQFIEPNQFIVEYTGEVLTRAEYSRRNQISQNTRHSYGVQIKSNEVVDATRKGSLARFANHSCSPNCQLERREVNGEVCCGLFAIETIVPKEEITFSYRSFRNKIKGKRCMCGTARCRGFVPV